MEVLLVMRIHFWILLFFVLYPVSGLAVVPPEEATPDSETESGSQEIQSKQMLQTFEEDEKEAMDDGTTESKNLSPDGSTEPGVSTPSAPQESGDLTEDEQALLNEGFSSVDNSASPGLITKLMPDISLSLNTTAAWFSQEEDASQMGSHDAKTNGFNLNQVELNLSSNVDPYFGMSTIIIVGSHGFELEEAFATTSALPWGLQMRAGYFFTRFGRLNPIHLHGWNFLDMAIVNAKFFGGEGSRGLGGEMSWLMPTPWYSEIVYSTTMVNNSAEINASFQIEQSHDEHAEEEEGEEEDVHDEHNHGSQIAPTSYHDLLTTVSWKNFHEMGANWGLKWGLSGQYGPYLGGHTELYGADFYLRYKPVASQQKTAFSILAEVMLRRRIAGEGHDHDHEDEHGSDVLQDYGGNFELTWDFAKRWSLGARYGFVTGVDEDPLQPSWTEIEHKGSLQASFKPSEFSMIRLQGNVHTFGGHEDHTGEDLHGGHGHEDPLGFSVLLGFAFNIGHHPPHQY
jgi:hypothetical protein